MAAPTIPRPDLPKEVLDTIDTLSDSELRALLNLPEDRQGLRYYLSKDQKKEYLRARTTQTRRSELLEAARARQTEHHVYLRRRRQEGSPDRQVEIEKRMGGRAWRFLREERRPEKFKDGVTGRQAMVAYIVLDEASGEELELTKGTLADAHERLGLILGWPQPRSRNVAPEAAKEGLATAGTLPSNLAFLRGN